MLESKSLNSVKRVTHLLISMGFWGVTYLWNLIRRIAGQDKQGTCVVLYYHRVPAIDRARFASQMDALLLLAKPIGMDAAPQSPTATRHVVVTFDDAYESAIENGLPELKKRGIPATVFVIANALGQHSGWENFSSGPAKHDRIISVEQLLKLQSDAVEIGSHTLNHRMLPSLTEEEARQEIAGSRAKLENLLGSEVKFFSFPYGAFNEKLIAMCRDAGYERVFTTLPLLAFKNPQEFVTGRVSVEPTDWPLEFRLKLLGAYRWLPLAFALKRRILSPFLMRAAGKSQPVAYAPRRDANS